MSALERFIRANVKLVRFEQVLNDSTISDSSVFALEVHRDELKTIWATIKSLYEKCIEELDDEAKESADKAIEDKDSGDKDSSSDSDDGKLDLNSVNARYQASYETYVKIVSKISASIHERTRVDPIPHVTTSSSNFHLPPCDTESFRGD